MIRSTMLFGNSTVVSTYLPSSGSRSVAYATKLRRAACPLPWMLSQLMIVNGGSPRSRRRASASVISPNVVFGGLPGCRSCRTSGLSATNSPVTALMLYPPSVTVSETIRTSGAAIFSITASGSSGAYRYSLIEPITRALEAAVRRLDDQRVEPVLGVHHLLHAPVAGHHADPADRPVQRLAVVHQPVQVHRLVRPMEATDPEVHDPGTQLARSYEGTGRSSGRDDRFRSLSGNIGVLPALHC